LEIALGRWYLDATESNLPFKIVVEDPQLRSLSFLGLPLPFKSRDLPKLPSGSKTPPDHAVKANTW
jgi:hypothetical protein